jgi:hypothetical protein
LTYDFSYKVIQIWRKHSRLFYILEDNVTFTQTDANSQAEIAAELSAHSVIQAAVTLDAGLAEVVRRYTAQKLREPEPVAPPTLEVPELPEYARLREGLGAHVCPWLDEYIRFSRTWSPRSYDGYHEACAIWLLSTVAARRLKTDFGGSKFTPLYILLAGRSSLYAKTTAANIAIDTLRAAGLYHHLAPDQSTPQKFLSLLTSRLPEGYDEMCVEKKDLVRQRLGLCGARGWFHEEFGSQVRAMMQPSGFMSDFRGLLRKFDDCPESFENATISRDVEFVERPYLALLGNLTPADLKKFAQKGSELWGDGFLARFAIICPAQDDTPNTGEFPPGERRPPDGIVQPLRAWDRRLGYASVRITPPPDETDDIVGSQRLQVTPPPPTVLPMTAEVTRRFYLYLNALGQLSQGMNQTDLDGNYIRFAEKTLRIALLLASFSESPQIELEHWARAQEITERWRRGLHAIYESVNNSQSDAQEKEEKVLKVVERHGPVSATEVSRYTHGAVTETKNILDGLVMAGAMEICKTGKTVKYIIPIVQP